MKTKIFTCFLLIALLGFYSCQKEQEPETYPYKAEVLGLNSDCGVYQIKITAGQDRVESIVGNSIGTSIYIAKNLPEELKINGLKISLDLRKPIAENNELGVCTTQGPSYTWIFVTRAKKE